MFSKKISLNKINLDYFKIGNNFFLIGIFFLPSALPIGGIFLLISLFISFIINKENLFQSRWNSLFLVSIIGIIFSTLYNSFINPSENIVEFDKSLIWLNLFNWIPIFLCYLGSQVYLKSRKQIILFIKFLIAGTIPVIASCILQKYFGIYGPFSTLYGTIVWFNYNFSEQEVLRTTGLFNNPNYLGMWLVICLPFSLSLLNQEKDKLKWFFLFIINIFFTYFAFSTYSRNAFFGIILSFLIVFERKKLIYLSILFLGGFLIFGYFLPNLLDINFTGIIDLSAFTRSGNLSSFNASHNHPRIVIWKSVVQFISARPFLGWGGGTFAYMFAEKGRILHLQNYQHSHNILFEIAYNFGIPTALLIGSTILVMISKGLKRIYNFKKSISKHSFIQPIVACCIIFSLAHMTDITYYDGKISIIFSLILAALKNIIDKNNILDKEKILSTDYK